MIPGVRMNLSKSGPSLSLGTRGLRHTIGPKGSRTTVGIPGTGLSWTEYSSHLEPSAPRLPSADGAAGTIEPPLKRIESASVERMGTLSTSDFAPILSATSQKSGFAPWVAAICLGCVVLALNSGDQTWLNLVLVSAIVFVPAAILLDRYRRSIWIEYLLEGTAKTVAEALADTLGELKSCRAVWQVNAEGRTTDWKRNAGATTLNRRKRIQLNIKRPKYIRGNVKFPAIKLQNQSLYFLPDTVLVAAGRSMAAIPYQKLIVSTGSVRFIEDEAVPADASIVDKTWRFVNKNGGPDRRFNNNRQLPICMYGEMNFFSESGLNCKIEYSKVSGGDRFSKALAILHRPELLIRSKPITSFQKAKTWPSVLFLACFLSMTIVPAIAPFERAYFDKSSKDGQTNTSISVSKTAADKRLMADQHGTSIKSKRWKRAVSMPLVITPNLRGR